MPRPDPTRQLRPLHALQESHAPALGFEGGAEHVHGAGEAFPRETVRDLIGDTLWAVRRRELWQDAAVTLAIALFALALPTERLLGDGISCVQWTAAGQWLSINPVVQPLARLLAALPRVDAEMAWYLIAALSWAGTYPVLVRMNVALGFPRLTSCASALLVVLSPVAVLAATLPGPAGTALLGSSILFATLMTIPSRREDGSWSARPLAVWLGVCLLDPNLVLFMPALVFHRLATPQPGPLTWRALARAVAAPLGVLVLLSIPMVLAGLLGRGGHAANSLWQALAGRLSGATSSGSPESLIWLIVLPPAVGVGVIGIHELFRRSPDRRNWSAPGWIAVFVAVPVGVKVLGGAPNLSMAAWVLGPLTAVGLASFLDRWTAPQTRLFILGLAGAQLALTVGFKVTVRLGDPLRPWSESATKFLERGDIVLTRDQRHEYLLHNRYHVRTINLRTPRELDENARADWWARSREVVRAQARDGGRVVVDWRVADPEGEMRGYPFQQELHELVLLAPVVHLDVSGERTDDPAELTKQLRRSPDGL